MASSHHSDNPTVAYSSSIVSTGKTKIRRASNPRSPAFQVSHVALLFSSGAYVVGMLRCQEFSQIRARRRPDLPYQTARVRCGWGSQHATRTACNATHHCRVVEPAMQSKSNHATPCLRWRLSPPRFDPQWSLDFRFSAVRTSVVARDKKLDHLLTASLRRAKDSTNNFNREFPPAVNHALMV